MKHGPKWKYLSGHGRYVMNFSAVLNRCLAKENAKIVSHGEAVRGGEREREGVIRRIFSEPYERSGMRKVIGSSMLTALMR